MKHSTINAKAKNSRKIANIASRVAAAVFWIVLWQFAAMRLGQEILLASPVSVIRRLVELVMLPEFWQSIWFSFGRIAVGFLLALFSGILFAVASYLFSFVEILIKPLTAVMKSTPVASIIILCLIWIPSRNLSVFISFLMVFPVVYTNVLEGLRQTDKKLLEMAEVFDVGVGKRICYIYLSELLPYLLTACSLGLGLCWKAGVAAEVIGVPKGSIGENLYNAKIYLNTPDLFAWTVVIIIISVLLEKCVLALLKYFVHLVEQR